MAVKNRVQCETCKEVMYGHEAWEHVKRTSHNSWTLIIPKKGEITTMKCPKCGELLEAHINKYQDEDSDYIEVEIYCADEHTYFTRIKEDDLIECQ